MGLDVVLYRVVRSAGAARRPSFVPVEVVDDSDDVLLGLLTRVRGGGRTPLLDRFDPAGELVVSAPEAPRLLAELRCLAESAASPAEMARLRSLAALTRRCMRGHDVEIRLEGD
ncbi:hypothetical protein [Micromonospora sagamiensis]|uniref:Uncharacterized protein n=1 Tax=Micromonospora sagamiensis TaxID=47875 RepID=A0A562WKJ2_9ACTN|nr:hypothetical protein [Micromonospora sagamiensis]TWJ30725.1 hypothetical protein JD81_04271 [Micromonospora sagamiensis]BCL16239.1 hypothetical protein GCM10017556_39780 [Micromonospora sagamiensis]